MNPVIHDVGRSSGEPASVVGSLSTTNVRSPVAPPLGATLAALPPGATDAGLPDGVAPPHALTMMANTASIANPRRFAEIIRRNPPHGFGSTAPSGFVRSMIRARDWSWTSQSGPSGAAVGA